MSGSEPADELRQLREHIAELGAQLAEVASQAEAAQHEAHQAREEVIRLRQQVTAAERDQQDLKTLRARLARMQLRGLLARLLNRQ